MELTRGQAGWSNAKHIVRFKNQSMVLLKEVGSNESEQLYETFFFDDEVSAFVVRTFPGHWLTSVREDEITESESILKRLIGLGRREAVLWNWTIKSIEVKENDIVTLDEYFTPGKQTQHMIVTEVKDNKVKCFYMKDIGVEEKVEKTFFSKELVVVQKYDPDKKPDVRSEDSIDFEVVDITDVIKQKIKPVITVVKHQDKDSLPDHVKKLIGVAEGKDKTWRDHPSTL